MTSPNDNSLPTANPAESSALPYADGSTPAGHDLTETGGVTRLDVATIAIRLLGIYLLIQVSPAIFALGAVVWEALTQRSRFSPDSATALRSAFYLALSILLLIYGQKLARRILPAPEAAMPLPSARMSPGDLQGAAFGVIGIILVVMIALPGIILDLSEVRFGRSPSSSEERWDRYKPFLSAARH